MTRTLALIALSLCFAACEKKPEPTPTTTTAPAATATTPAATEPAAANADEAGDIPTEQDYEDEAERTITAENLESELDKLEKEIGEDS